MEDNGVFIATEIENLIEEIYEKMDEIVDHLKQADEWISDRAEMYWLAHIDGALKNRGGNLGGSFISAKDTLAELRGEIE